MPMFKATESFPVADDADWYPVADDADWFPVADDADWYPVADDADWYPVADDADWFPVADDADRSPVADDADWSPVAWLLVAGTQLDKTQSKADLIKSGSKISALKLIDSEAILLSWSCVQIEPDCSVFQNREVPGG